ncbi:MAG TPA: LUD domain-containing protein [Candidatus Saccharimonadales bacterium]|nr:LUD domain-containing protein [Candidatus Saccharimonadales bacterium]
MSYDTIASDEIIEKTQIALEANGMKVTIAQDRAAATAAVLDLLPKGAEVLTSTSKTLEALELTKIIDESGDYDAVRPKLNAMWGDPTKKREQRKLGAAPDYVLGSVHAITQDGVVFIVSNTGSQLPSYSYGAGNVIWVVGAQKLVTDLEDAKKRLDEYIFPLENERAKQAYGSGTQVSKILTVHKEVAPGRITIIIVKEALGF